MLKAESRKYASWNEFVTDFSTPKINKLQISKKHSGLPSLKCNCYVGQPPSESIDHETLVCKVVVAGVNPRIHGKWRTSFVKEVRALRNE